MNQKMSNMRVEQKSHVKNSIGRLLFAALSVLLQIAWFLVLFINLRLYSDYISLAMTLLAIVVAIFMYRRDTNGAFKLSWVFVILAFPVLGLGIYLLLGRPDTTKGMRKKFEQNESEIYSRLTQEEAVFTTLSHMDLSVANQCHYIHRWGRFPVYNNTDIKYHKDTSAAFEDLKEALSKARKFIFMEYHAIEDDKAFDELVEILEERAKSGVEVRILYDDMGSIFFINKDFINRMEERGIKCMSFNPVVPVLRLFMNNRDHRKITVIDGEIAFTGGYNLANEYFNISSPYGYWKDTGIKLTGDAVRSMTVMFLGMWNGTEKVDEEIDLYFPDLSQDDEEDGISEGKRERSFVQPYADSPLDNERMGENVYMNLIKNAKKYLYIMTPYLILTDEMSREISLAAKRGVDVRIITPGIPDKKIVYKITRSNYAPLVRSGVRVFEYTPGFCHGKMCISDDEIAVVGTINFDYRSLYHHFENAVLIYKNDAILDIKDDFVSSFEECEEVTEEYKAKSGTALRLEQCILQIFAPLA